MKPTILATLFVLAAATASASSFTVTLDTSSLTGMQTVGFALTEYDSSSNAVSLSAFDFAGGSALAGTPDCTFGGAFSGVGCSGDLDAGITLTDLDRAGAFFTQQFDAGSSLSFTMTTSNSFSGSGIPDQFAMYVCDGALTTCYSDDATGALLLLQLSGGALMPSSFVTFAASGQDLPAPVVTEIARSPDPIATVPEPATLLLLGSGLTAALARRRRD